MATDFSPDLSRFARRHLVGDAELRRLLLLLKRCFERVVVAHPSGQVIWLSDSTRRVESLNFPMILKRVEATPDDAETSSFAELVAEEPQPSPPGTQEAGAAPIPFKIFPIRH